MKPNKTLLDRLARLMPAGVPRYVRCYDNGGDSGDRYTVVFTGRAAASRAPGCLPEYSYRAMSAHPYSPQGIGLWGFTKGQPCDTLGKIRGRWYWPPAVGRKCHMGRRITFAQLPDDCRRLVLADYREIWGLQ